MARIRNTLFLLILLAAILAGATKALLWYYTDKTAKDIQQILPPNMFNYAGISTSLKGEASIDGITLLIREKSFKIKKIEFVARDLPDFLKLIYKNWGKKIPDQFAINIHDITINTSSLLSDHELSNQIKSNLNIPCGKVKTIGLAEYIEMGYPAFTFNLNINYEKISSTYLKSTIELNAPNITHFILSYKGKLSPSDLGEIAASPIPNFELQVKDYSLQKSIYNYCAKKEQQNIDEYMKNLPPSSKDEIDLVTTRTLGLTLSNEIINALNEYYKTPKDFHIALHPKGNVTLKELHAMNEQVAISLLRPELRVNGKNIPINFNWTSLSQLAQKKQIVTTPKIKLIADERLLTPFDKLNGAAFNKNIEVYMASGTIYKGAFRKVEGNLLYMSIQKRTGSSELALKRDMIKLIYVLSDY